MPSSTKTAQEKRSMPARKAKAHEQNKGMQSSKQQGPLQDTIIHSITEGGPTSSPWLETHGTVDRWSCLP